MQVMTDVNELLTSASNHTLLNPTKKCFQCLEVTANDREGFAVVVQQFCTDSIAEDHRSVASGCLNELHGRVLVGFQED